MLRLIGIYIPFILVFLGIAGCGYFYRDTILDRFNNDDPVIEEPIENAHPTEPELQTDVADDARSGTFDDVVTEETPEEVSDERPELPGIGECVCPKADGTL